MGCTGIWLVSSETTNLKECVSRLNDKPTTRVLNWTLLYSMQTVYGQYTSSDLTHLTHSIVTFQKHWRLSGSLKTFVALTRTK